jgi:Mn-containing catalase
VENAGIRDMLQDIALEKFSHLEMVGKLIAQHTSKTVQVERFQSRHLGHRLRRRG